MEKEREEITKIRNIDIVHVGNYAIKTWYFSPFPEEYRDLHILHVCEYCFKYMKYPESLERHQSNCSYSQPPGKIVYFKLPYKIYQVDGKQDKVNSLNAKFQL